MADVGRQLAAAGEHRLGVAGRELGQELPPAVAHALGFHQEDELVRAEADGDLRRDFLQRQVEDLAGRRVAERRDQHDVAVVEALADRIGVDAAHLARQLHVDAVDDAERLRGDEVARRHADARARHRRVGDAEREQRLDPAPHLAAGLEHAVHRLGVGDAQSERVAALDVLLREDRLDLRPRAVHDDDAHAEAVQQVQVVDDAEERLVGDDLAAERDDERPAAKRVDVRRRRRIHWTNARVVAECAVGAAMGAGGIRREPLPDGRERRGPANYSLPREAARRFTGTAVDRLYGRRDVCAWAIVNSLFCRAAAVWPAFRFLTPPHGPAAGLDPEAAAGHRLVTAPANSAGGPGLHPGPFFVAGVAARLRPSIAPAPGVPAGAPYN